MTLQEDVGRAIRTMRQHAGLSQHALAEATGRSVQMIGFIERGKRAPSFETLKAIAAVLGAEARDFFPGAAHVQDEVMARIVGLVSPLNEKEKTRAYRILLALLDDR